MYLGARLGWEDDHDCGEWDVHRADLGVSPVRLLLKPVIRPHRHRQYCRSLTIYYICLDRLRSCCCPHTPLHCPTSYLPC